MSVILPKTPSFRLDGRTALVAGASSGIGQAAAVALAEAGARVTLIARSADKLEQTATALQERGLLTETLALDVQDVEATERKIAAHAPFDILVNSAGMARHGPAVETALSDFDAVFGLNVRGAYFLDPRAGKDTDRGPTAWLADQHLLTDGPCRRYRPGRLRRHQACRGGLYQIDGDRMGAPRHPHQHDLPDLHPHAACRADVFQP
ncbi:exported hypothetical protein [Agrobacterium tumefaciens str. Kerr 14]|uniref:Uncharacterized protein n=1 Tax=Agrobacterium tumefaciens str. Kerr 14 TaxID=1183424 RepID=A0A1S7SBZ0_AGRTU|nr:exported hypothetical protein [Agrobacterium tumefaciens str. Kerr 14]